MCIITTWLLGGKICTRREAGSRIAVGIRRAIWLVDSRLKGVHQSGELGVSTGDRQNGKKHLDLWFVQSIDEHRGTLACLVVEIFRDYKAGWLSTTQRLLANVSDRVWSLGRAKKN
jgi:hypothetical protein